MEKENSAINKEDSRRKTHAAAARLCREYIRQTHAFLTEKRVAYFATGNFVMKKSDVPFLSMSSAAKTACGFFGDKKSRMKAVSEIETHAAEFGKYKTDPALSDIAGRIGALSKAAAACMESGELDERWSGGDGLDRLRALAAKILARFMNLLESRFQKYALAAGKKRLFGKKNGQEEVALKMRAVDHDIAFLASDMVKLPKMLSPNFRTATECCEFYRQYFLMRDRFTMALEETETRLIAEELALFASVCTEKLRELEEAQDEQD